MTALSWIGSLPIQSWCEAMSLKEQTASEKGILSQISKLTLQQNSVNTQLSVYSQLNSMLQSFQTSVTQLTNSFSATFQVASSNSNIATAQISNSSSIASGSHALNVTKLAQGSSTASQEYLSKTAALNMTNSLTMTVGTEHITVNVGATDTLDSIAANINANAKATGLGVSASVVSTGADGAGVTHYRLVVSSKNTGINNAVSITETGTGGNALNIAMNSDSTVGTGTKLLAAQDAQFTLDDLPYTSPTNTNIAAAGGLTLSLTGLTTGTPVSISVSSSNQVSNVTTAVQGLISSYNQLLTFIQIAQATITAPATDSSKVTTSPMDSAIASVQAGLQNVMGAGSSSYQILKSVGVELASASSQTITLPNSSTEIKVPITGLLQLHTNTLDGGKILSEQLASNYAGVQATLTNSTDGITTNLTKLMMPTTGAISKALDDGNSGAIIKAKKTLKLVQDQISDLNDSKKSLEEALIIKYANLEMSLTLIQNTSIYISQTVDNMSGK